jgi:hypothetical protein
VNPDDGGAKFFRNVVLTRATGRNVSEDAIPHIVCKTFTDMSEENVPSIFRVVATLLAE